MADQETDLMESISLLASILILAVPTVGAQTVTYDVHLDHGQVVPPPGSGGTGSATVVLDLVSRRVGITGTYSQLNGDLAGVHLHGPAPIGSNAPGVVVLAGSGGTEGTFTGEGVFTPSQVDDVLKGLWYLDIHSAEEPGGEVRGQVVQRLNSECAAAQRLNDPVLLDSGGTRTIGPRIGSSSEPFNLSIDCTWASSPGMFLVEIRTGKLDTPRITRYGAILIGGSRILGKMGSHSMSIEDWFAVPAVLPRDLSLPGVTYHAQGFCGGYAPLPRVSNSLTQTIGI